jgi:hypothetical protein
MLNNPIDEFTAGLQPADILTLLAGLRNSVPVYAALGATGLNEGEDAELARRRPPAQAPAPRARTYEDDQRDFEAQFPDPKIRSAVLAELIAQRTQPYHPATATRRKDFEAAPDNARQSMQPMARKKFAGGGTVQSFNKGGKAAKTLDQMAAELFKKGAKTADKPDLARRSLFGLGPQSSFPLANVDTKALEKMQQELKGAPSITEKSVTVDPGKGGMSETIKSVAATPMSRRSVLQSAAGQVVRGVLPDMTGLGALGNAAKAVESVAPKAVPAIPQTLPGLIAHFAKKGLDEEETLRKLRRLGYDEDDVVLALTPMRNPDEFFADLGEEAMTPSHALAELLNTGTSNPPMSMRSPLREIRRENPDLYKDLIRSARDMSEYGFEP